MKRNRSALSVAVLLGLTVVGCSSPREKAADGMLDVMGEFVDRIAKIKNNVDLVDAKPDLDRLSARMKDAVKKMNDVGMGTAEERKALQAKLKPKSDKISARLRDEMTRLGKDVGPEAAFTVMEFFGSMGDMDFKE